MDMISILTKRRDGVPQTQEEIEFLICGATNGSIPDYQLSAWLMANFHHPLGLQETVWLTQSMARSGDVLDLSSLGDLSIDKHSTGGVGDKTSLVLMPLLASAGLKVVKMSGRGLGITGGTVDKLESIPGMRMDLSPADLLSQAAEIGMAITGPTAKLAPADKVLYALRDVTATVPCLPLIVSSILSKKLAAGARNVILDVKFGSGAFMSTLEDATRLATLLKEVGEGAGLRIKIALSDMNQPLGSTIGNALEVKEAIRVLSNQERGPFRQLCVELGALGLTMTGLTDSLDAANGILEDCLESGAACRMAKLWVVTQGGDGSVFDTETWAVAPHQTTVTSEMGGYIAKVDARAFGQAVVDLGGGRKQKNDQIDPAVGIELMVSVGDQVKIGDPLYRIHASSAQGLNPDELRLRDAIQFSHEPVARQPQIYRVL